MSQLLCLGTSVLILGQIKCSSGYAASRSTDFLLDTLSADKLSSPVFFFIFLLATPMACRSSLARNQTHATAVI